MRFYCLMLYIFNINTSNCFVLPFETAISEKKVSSLYLAGSISRFGTNTPWQKLKKIIYDTANCCGSAHGSGTLQSFYNSWRKKDG